MIVGHPDLQAIADTSVAQIPERFSDAAEWIEKIRAIGNKVDSRDMKFVEEFGNALYGAYYNSSGYLTNFMGSKLVLEAFRVLAPYKWIIDQDDYEHFLELPDSLVVYRGGKGPADELKKGISWTLTKSAAKTFTDAPGSIVISTKVKRDHLLAYMDSLRECILDPEKIVAVKVER
jgi:hypothetical protein